MSLASWLARNSQESVASNIEFSHDVPHLLGTSCFFILAAESPCSRTPSIKTM